MKVGRRTVEVTRPDKELFPGISKQDLCRYYAEVAPAMLPYLADKPLTLERYPDGIDGMRVMQKNIPSYFPAWIARARVRKKGGWVEHVLATEAATLVYLANQAAITLHVWLSDVERPDHPDQLVLDLDPTGCRWDAVVGVTRTVHDVLQDVGVVPFLKTSGSRGLHVHVPLDRSAPFADVRAFVEDVARVVAVAEPRHVTTVFRKAERQGCLFLDTGRNAYAQTAVAPYAVRARAGAPVAVPLAWEELDDRRFRPDAIGMRTALARVADGADPWRGFGRHRRSLAVASRRIARMRQASSATG